jgi:hypothetical protein
MAQMEDCNNNDDDDNDNEMILLQFTIRMMMVWYGMVRLFGIGDTSIRYVYRDKAITPAWKFSITMALIIFKYF